MVRTGIETPVGPISVTVEDEAIVAVGWLAAPLPMGGLAAEALAQVADWFAGRRRAFDLPLAPATGFGAAMRAAMLAIPFGETRTYGDIARDLGVTAQAVGQGCGANPMPLIVPCHRVLGASGLGGYSGRGGVETKVALLRFEGAAGLLI
jgi:methylated-DNA-[protein]-cysteine S-methyltransferase